MAFVRLSQHSDYGKPYQSMQAAQDQARRDMSYAVSALTEKPVAGGAAGNKPKAPEQNQAAK